MSKETNECPVYIGPKYAGKAKFTLANDMDGVYADFYEEDNYLDRMWEDGFYYNLKPEHSPCKALEKIAQRGDVDIYLNTAGISEQCFKEKQMWSKDWLPFVKDMVYCDMSVGKKISKAEAAEIYLGRKLTKTDFLIDDFSQNLVDWEAHGGTGIKFRNRINGKGTNGTNYGGPQVFYSSSPDELEHQLLTIMGIEHDDSAFVSDRDRMLQVIDDYLDAKGFERRDGVWWDAIYATAYDSLSDEQLCSIFQSRDPGMAFEEYMDHIYGDLQYSLHYAVANELRNEISKLGGRFADVDGEFLDRKVEQEFQSIVDEYYWDVDLPRDHYLKQEIKVDIYLHNDVSEREYGDILDQFGFLNMQQVRCMPSLLKLGELMGYSRDDFRTHLKNYVDAENAYDSMLSASRTCHGFGWLNEEEFTEFRKNLENWKDNNPTPDGFCGSVYQELSNLPTTCIGTLVMLVTMTVEELINLVQLKESFYRNTAVRVSRGTICGVYDPSGAGGSLFEIVLDRDFDLPLKDIASIGPDGMFGTHSITKDYDMCSQAWSSRLGELSKSDALAFAV